ncbi:efflux transporter outer membrane subunit [Roseateles sp. 22389]|uniref:efflux transporter outer membrane subunit n=1 Tax=Roseateles sp. 22389 TaxID=3453916 RepID=UPI003F86D76F
MAGLLSALAVAGCSFAPPAQRPEMRMPARLSGDGIPVSGQPRPDVALTPQERDFISALAPDRDLASLVAWALAANTDHRLALLQVEQSRAQYRVQQADRWPTVGLSATQTRQRFDSAERDGRYGQKLVSATVGISDFELDLFGRLKSLSDAARERYLASSQGQQAVRGALVAEVLRLYILERSAAQALGVTSELRIQTAELLSIGQRQRSVGLASDNDVDRLRAQDDRAAIAEAQAREARLGALRALKLVAGVDVTPAGPLEPLARVPSPPGALRDLDSRLLLQRPDVQQAESELRAAHADIGAARAAFFPSVRLSTGIGTASEGLRGLFGVGSGVWSFIPQLTLPLFDHGRRQAELDLAQARREASVIGYEQAVQHAFREVLEALDAQATVREAERRQADQDDRVQRRMQRATARAEAGWVDRADLLAERIAAQQSALARLESQRDLALNRVALFRAFYGVSLPASVASL